MDSVDSSSWLPIVLNTIASEFSDITDLAQATRIVLRLLFAALLGGLLGWEREAAGKAAGVRTHMLVAMGSALFVMVTLQVGAQANEASRVIQGVIAGIGFLGAGTILKEQMGAREKPIVIGLTTAAGIWLTAAIGVACGLGEEATAVLSALIAWCILAAVPVLMRAAGLEDARHRPTEEGTPAVSEHAPDPAAPPSERRD